MREAVGQKRGQLVLSRDLQASHRLRPVSGVIACQCVHEFRLREHACHRVTVSPYQSHDLPACVFSGPGGTSDGTAGR